MNIINHTVYVPVWLYITVQTDVLVGARYHYHCIKVSYRKDELTDLHNASGVYISG